MSIYFEIHAGQEENEENEGHSFHCHTILAEEGTMDGNENTIYFFKISPEP